MQPRPPIMTNPTATRLARQVTAHTGILQSHQDRIATLERDRDIRRASLEELKRRLEQRISADVPEALINSLRGEIASVQRGIVLLDSELHDLRSTVATHGQRLDDHDLKFTQLGDRVEGVEVTANASAAAINELRDAHSWVPLALAALAGLVTYVVIEIVRPGTATNIQWCWTLIVAAIVGLVAGMVLSNRQAVSTAVSSARASARRGGQTGDDPSPVVETTPVVDAQPTAEQVSVRQSPWQPGQPAPADTSVSAGAAARASN